MIALILKSPIRSAEGVIRSISITSPDSLGPNRLLAARARVGALPDGSAMPVVLSELAALPLEVIEMLSEEDFSRAVWAVSALCDAASNVE